MLQSGSTIGGEAADDRLALLLDTDLFFSVKVTDTLKHAGYRTHTMRRMDEFIRALSAQPITVALVNTAARGVDWRAAIAAASAAHVPIIAFGPHIDIATQEEARRAGATSVIPNSKLASDLPGVVARALRRIPQDQDRQSPANAGDEPRVSGTDIPGARSER